MKALLLLTMLSMAVSSCTMIDEQGSRGGQQVINPSSGPSRWAQPVLASAPDTYRQRIWQMGGVFTSKNSMGSEFTADNQVSFKDAMQAAGAITTSVYAFKAYAAGEVTKRLIEGEITKRQAATLNQQLALVQTQAEVDMFIAGLEVLP